jgi:hypothetical protein
MADVTIYDLPAASTLDGSEEVAIWKNGETEKTTAQEIADLAGGGYTQISGTLVAGNTTVSLSDASITTSSVFDFYTTIFGVNPTAVSVSTGTIVLTFEAQVVDVGVIVRVS